MHIVRGRARFRRLEPPAFADSSPEEAWLRRNTRYLLESARVAALGGMSLLYGILVNLFLVAGVLVFAAWWLGWFYSASGGLTNWNTAEASAAQYDHAWSWVTWTALLPLAAMAIFIAADAADRLFVLPASLRTGARWVCVLLLVLGLGALLGLFVAPWLMVTAHNFAADSGSPLARLITAAGLIPPDLCETLVKTGDACGSTGGAPSRCGGLLITFATGLAAIIAVLRQARRFLPDVAGPKADAGALYKLVDRVLLRLLPWAAPVRDCGGSLDSAPTVDLCPGRQPHSARPLGLVLPRGRGVRRVATLDRCEPHVSALLLPRTPVSRVRTRACRHGGPPRSVH